MVQKNRSMDFFGHRNGVIENCIRSLLLAGITASPPSSTILSGHFQAVGFANNDGQGVQNNLKYALVKYRWDGLTSDVSYQKTI